MFLGFRFIRKNGSYHQGDPLDSPEAVYQYVNQHKNSYPEIRITDSTKNDLIVHAVDGRIMFPKQLSLIEIRDTYLSDQSNFDNQKFLEALRLVGFCNHPDSLTFKEAELLLLSCYEKIDCLNSID